MDFSSLPLAGDRFPALESWPLLVNPSTYQKGSLWVSLGTLFPDNNINQSSACKRLDKAGVRGSRFLQTLILMSSSVDPGYLRLGSSPERTHQQGNWFNICLCLSRSIQGRRRMCLNGCFHTLGRILRDLCLFSRNISHMMCLGDWFALILGLCLLSSGVCESIHYYLNSITKDRGVLGISKGRKGKPRVKLLQLYRTY